MNLKAPVIKWLLNDQIFRVNTVGQGYNDTGLYDTSLVASDVLWCKFVTVNSNITLIGYDGTKWSVTFHDVVTKFDCNFDSKNRKMTTK